MFGKQPLTTSSSRGDSKVYAELQRCLDLRVAEEACGVEVAMAMARECIDKRALIEHEWILQVSLSFERACFLRFWLRRASSFEALVVFT